MRRNVQVRFGGGTTANPYRAHVFYPTIYLRVISGRVTASKYKALYSKGFFDRQFT